MRVLILGAGSSGKSAKQLLQSQGHDVMMYDDQQNALFQMPCQSTICNFDLCVISPGVSKNHPLAIKCKDKLISELDLGFFERTNNPVIAVTGTNGKTTVVNMIHRALGDKSVLCGNVGVPVTSVVKELETKIAVVEVSSFQLEVPPKYFKPNIGVLLNIAQDHLDRHITMEEYTACKMRIAGDITILNYDDEILREQGESSQNKILWFSLKERVDGIYLDGNDIVINLDGKTQKVFSLDEFGELAPHDIQNILATALVCHLMGVPKQNVVRACTSKKDPHRLEFVRAIQTSTAKTFFYNDSKATNVASCLAACRSFSKPVNLILGGVGKGQNFAELFQKLPKNIKHIFAIGESADEIINASKNSGQVVIKCSDLKTAVEQAYQTQIAGDKIVLLSPACASFDMFKSYADRGEQFKEIVSKI